MKLFIRHPNGQKHPDLASAAWQRFIQQIHPIPLAISTVTYQTDWNAVDGLAESHVRLKGDGTVSHLLIRLSERFFDAEPERQDLTLLHEMTHLRMLSGPMIERVRRADQFGRDNSGFRGKTPDERSFEVQRVALARNLYFMVDEAIAEKHLQCTYPELPARRLEQYAAIQEESWQSRAHEQTLGGLRRYAVFWHLLRNRLGEQLASGRPEMQMSFRERANALDARLLELCDAEQCAQLKSLIDRILTAEPSGPTWDEDAANQLFERVMSTPFAAANGSPAC